MREVLVATLRRMFAQRGQKTWKYMPETVAMVIALTAVPMVAGWVPPNPYYGFRTPATMATPDAWHFANRLMGCYMIASQGIAVASMSRLAATMETRFGGDRVVWGVLWTCATALLGIGIAVLHYYRVA